MQKRFISQRFKKIVYNLSGMNKYGLLRDDLQDYTKPEVQEALRRLPEHVIDERNYRIMRAMQLSIENEVLPKAQWTKFEDDKLYLTPIIMQVLNEKDEEMQWNKKY